MANHPPEITIVIGAVYASARAGLRALLADEPGLRVIGDAADADSLADAGSQLAPDAMVIDYDDRCGRGMLEAALDDGAATIVLGLPGSDIGAALASTRSGVAVLPREADAAEIAGAVRAAAAGLIAVDRSRFPAAAARSESAADFETEREPLSPRELQVLQLLSSGLPNKQIATRLSISPHTVKFHVAGLLAKLGAASRTEAVAIGIRRGEVVL